MNLIDLLKYLFLAILQGVTEILPISSSGHLALFQAILGTNQGNEAIFALLLHLGSLIAFIIFFFPIIIRLMTHFILWLKGNRSDVVNDDLALIGYLIVATVPAALVGYLIKDAIDVIFQSLWFVAIGFYLTASLLFILPRYAKLSYGQYTFKNTFLAGLFQVLGILPGISRSGTTLLGSLLGGLTLARAKEFAFLLFIPITIGSFIFSLENLNQFEPLLLTYSLIAMVVTIFVTWITLKLVFKHLNFNHFKWFGFYLILIGTITLIIAI
jgi:undecaprenyl-diphosphatase